MADEQRRVLDAALALDGELRLRAVPLQGNIIANGSHVPVDAIDIPIDRRIHAQRTGMGAAAPTGKKQDGDV